MKLSFRSLSCYELVYNYDTDDGYYYEFNEGNRLWSVFRNGHDDFEVCFPVDSVIVEFS